MFDEAEFEFTGGTGGGFLFRLTSGIVPEGAKPQSVLGPVDDEPGVAPLVMLFGLGDAASGVGSVPPAIGIQGWATRVFGDMTVFEEMMSGFDWALGVVGGGAGVRLKRGVGLHRSNGIITY